MSFFSDVDMTDLRTLHDEALSDTCIHMVHAGGSGNYGYGVPTYTPGSPLSCLAILVKQNEAMGGTQVNVGDRRFRFSRDVILSNKDRLKLTKLHGDLLGSPETYEIIAGPQTTHVGTEAVGRLVTDGSET